MYVSTCRTWKRPGRSYLKTPREQSGIYCCCSSWQPKPVFCFQTKQTFPQTGLLCCCASSQSTTAMASLCWSPELSSSTEGENNQSINRYISHPWFQGANNLFKSSPARFGLRPSKELRQHKFQCNWVPRIGEHSVQIFQSRDWESSFNSKYITITRCGRKRDWSTYSNFTLSAPSNLCSSRGNKDPRGQVSFVPTTYLYPLYTTLNPQYQPVYTTTFTCPKFTVMSILVEPSGPSFIELVVPNDPRRSSPPDAEVEVT